MPLLSTIARKKKARYFLDAIADDAATLEIGCGDGWVGNYLKKKGGRHYTGLDIFPPADIIGDIKGWRRLGLRPASFDVIIAFEILEHVDCLQDCFDLLTPGGRLMMTSPVPHMDWCLKLLERAGLNQKRRSPHNNLTYFKDIHLFQHHHIKIIGFLAQWGIFTK